MNKELTKAEQLYEIAVWVKRQNTEFTKNFKSMRSIIKFYLQLPEDYDRKKSVVEYIHKGLRSDSYMEKRKAEKLSLIINTLFGFRFFKKAPKKWVLCFGLSRWQARPQAPEHIEVYCEPTDRCNIYDDFKQQTQAAHSITIKSLDDAKRAADQLLTSMTEKLCDDYEVEYGSKLNEAMKHSKPTNEQLTEGINVVL